MAYGDIVIEPFDPKALGNNSYDVHLGSVLKTYVHSRLLDCKREHETISHLIPYDGYVLHPNELYLASTVEYTESHKHVPFLDGKSSIGRLGIFIHCTAGRGDVGFCNHWTLEIVVVRPIRVYAGMPIGQLIYFETGPVEQDYSNKVGAKYNGRNHEPMPSQMWRNFK